MSVSDEAGLAITDHLSKDLTTRGEASRFFELIESSTADVVVINFEEVRSITGSFADGYVKCKRASSATIREENVPINVRRMLEIVSAPVEKRQVVNLEELDIIPL